MKRCQPHGVYPDFACTICHKQAKRPKGRPRGFLEPGSLSDQISRAKKGSIIWTSQNQKSVWSASAKNGYKVRTAVYWGINIVSGKTVKITGITKIN